MRKSNMQKAVTVVNSKPVGRKGLREINRDSAGIDVGSSAHYVAVPADRDGQPVRRFGCTTPELHAMAKWLKACGIKTVAAESTGVYWVPVLEVMEEYEIDL